jgi:hypothetical protein
VLGGAAAVLLTAGLAFPPEPKIPWHAVRPAVRDTATAAAAMARLIAANLPISQSRTSGLSRFGA